MSKIIGICGKGGTGKTTLAALTLKFLLQNGLRPVLMVDADPNANLGKLLGLSPEGDVGTICDGLLEETKKNPSSLSKPEFLRMALEQILIEERGYDLLTMGRPEGPGCYCYPNQVLRTVIERLSSPYPILVVDNEAGLEHLSRRLLRKLDLMIIVSGTSPRGLQTAARIQQLARELKIEVEEKCLAINRIKNFEVDWAVETSRWGLELGAQIPEDPLIEEFDLADRSLLQLPDYSPAWRAMSELLSRYLNP